MTSGVPEGGWAEEARPQGAPSALPPADPSGGAPLGGAPPYLWQTTVPPHWLPASDPPLSAPPLSAPPLSAPPLSAPPLSAPPFSAPPYGLPASGPPWGPPVTGNVYGYPRPSYAYTYPAPLPVVVARRRGAALRWIVGTLAVMLVCAVAAVGGVVGYADYTGALDTRASWRGTGESVDVPPAANAPAAEWTNWARRSLDDALAGQSESLLSDDEVGYLAYVDPTNTRLVAEHKRRFKVLRAMGPGVWQQTVSGGLRSGGSLVWGATVKISYCFGEATCRAAQISVATQWRFKNERLVMVQLGQSSSASNGPRPWEADDLSVATGRRVVLAATKVNAWRLKDAVIYADRAAAVADTFSSWEDPPSRYVIFLAGPGDWNQWYGHEQPDWAAAWAVPVSSTMREIVIQTRAVQQSGLEQLLTHELVHVASLAGKSDGAGSAAWWLIEGIAEYGSLLKQPVRDYDALSPTRAFVHDGWDGDPAVAPPQASATLEDAAGRYGIGYLAVRRIADKHGQKKLLDFFGRVVHDDDPIDTAAREALGASWASVKADCVAFIRRTVG